MRAISATTASASGVCSNMFEQSTPSTLASSIGILRLSVWNCTMNSNVASPSAIRARTASAREVSVSG